MSRYIPRNSADFESRQHSLPLMEACRFVAELAASVKKTLGNWWKTVKPTAPAPIYKVWQQLILEADDFHQITLEF